MKYVLFFFTLSILVASCGSFNNGKLRFVKTNNTQREIIETSAKSDEKDIIFYKWEELKRNKKAKKIYFQFQ